MPRLIRLPLLQFSRIAQVEAGISQTSEDGLTPLEQLIEIRQKIIPLLLKQQNHYSNKLYTELFHEGIQILDYPSLNNHQRKWVDNYFAKSIFPVLTPLAVDPAHPFPFVSNLSLNIAALIHDPETDQKQFARVKVPQKLISRFIEIPNNLNDKISKNDYTAIPLEQVIAFNLEMLFPGMVINDHYYFRVTRDADLELRDIEADDLMSALEQGLRKRRMGGEVVRLEVSEDMPKKVINMLQNGMKVQEKDLYQIKGLLGLDDLILLSNLNKKHLKYPAHTGRTPQQLLRSQQGMLEDGSIKQEEFKSIFSVIKKKDILLHHPYDLFSTTVEEFINQASEDPDVMGLKITLYRTSKDSPIIKALINAAGNGKQVMALVELKARFDEDNNIQWARQLEKSGVHVVYGVLGLKTHTKIVLVVRKEKERLQSYVHISTGNYNSKTSKLYTDIGLFSARSELGQDLVELFNYLTGFSKQQNFRKLLVAPVSLRKGMESLIKREIKNAKSGKFGHIKAKMNSLVDPSIIKLLYEASNAGVKIELIIRGMCCLIPGKHGFSENITVISIIDRFLEHSRIFWFFNNGKPEAYIGSADWMRRNLNRRVEAVTEIQDEDLRNSLEKILNLCLSDNLRAWEMQSNGSFIQRKPEKVECCAQSELIDLPQ